MVGETLMWYRLASHLHMPLQEVQTKTTTSEFFKWVQYFEWELNHKSKLDYYLAEIRAEIRRSYVKNPQKIKTMFVEYVIEKPKKVSKDVIVKSKHFWKSLAGGKKA